MPPAEDEHADPAAADHVYEVAGIKLRELTRSDKELLLKENIAYGFHRNMVAIKPIGLLVCVVALVFCALFSKAILWHAPYLDTDPVAAPGIAAGLGILVAFAMLGFLGTSFPQERGQDLRLCL